VRTTVLPLPSAPSLTRPLTFKTAEEAVAAIGQYFEIESWKVKGTDMSTLNFTVAAVYPPKDGFKTASIKTDTGKYISCWPTDQHLFQPGVAYSAVCGEFQKNDGTISYTVKSPGKGGNIQPQGGSPIAHAPSVASVTPNMSQAAPTGQNGLSKDEIITRLAIAKSCIESQQSQSDADSWLAWVLKEKSDAPESPQQLETDSFSDTDSIPF
jgi:hypothetical protein